MFRYNYNGKEIFIRFTSFTSNVEVNKDYLYRKIVSISDKMISAEHESSFSVEDEKGRLVIGTVQHGDITVISIHHIIDQKQMYTQEK